MAWRERELVTANDHQSGSDSADKASVPGESHPAEVVQGEVGQMLEQVVDLGSGEAPDGCPHDKRVGRVPLEALPLEGSREKHGGHQGGQRLADAVGLDVEAKD